MVSAIPGVALKSRATASRATAASPPTWRGQVRFADSLGLDFSRQNMFFFQPKLILHSLSRQKFVFFRCLHRDLADKGIQRTELVISPARVWDYGEVLTNHSGVYKLQFSRFNHWVSPQNLSRWQAALQLGMLAQTLGWCTFGLHWGGGTPLAGLFFLNVFFLENPKIWRIWGYPHGPMTSETSDLIIFDHFCFP